jgi:3-oxoacyl-[acyl-carrier-protein] synthase III
MAAIDPIRAGVVSGACQLPEASRTTWELFLDEGLDLATGISERLGVERVPICSGHKGSELAVAASLQAMARAGVSGADVDIVMDCTILPQRWMVPVR